MNLQVLGLTESINYTIHGLRMLKPGMEREILKYHQKVVEIFGRNTFIGTSQQVSRSLFCEVCFVDLFSSDLIKQHH